MDKLKIKQAIQTQMEQINADIQSLEAKCAPVAPDCSLGRLTRQEAMLEQEMYKRLLQEAQARLAKLRFVQNKVDDEAYGICRICEEPIAFERLLLLPESSVCIECAKTLRS